jgi:hypothetical protein
MNNGSLAVADSSFPFASNTMAISTGRDGNQNLRGDGAKVRQAHSPISVAVDKTGFHQIMRTNVSQS